VTFVDSNVPMYLVGADHPHKGDAQRILERLISRRRRLVTSSEVFQEMLHRYHAIGRRDAIDPAFHVLRGVVDDVFPIDEEDVFAAKVLVQGGTRLSARDALHVAVMQRRQIGEIVTFDRAFDGVAGLRRLPNAESGA
jgi:predicted nucleic acid-binding protein